MIKSSDVLRLNDVRALHAEAGKTFRKLTAEKDELERFLIEQSKTQKVEAVCPFRLQVQIEDKKYQPSYKQIAIEFGGEKAVTERAQELDPHETKEVLALIPKSTKPFLFSNTIRKILEALKSATL